MSTFLLSTVGGPWMKSCVTPMSTENEIINHTMYTKSRSIQTIQFDNKSSNEIIAILLSYS